MKHKLLQVIAWLVFIMDVALGQSQNGESKGLFRDPFWQFAGVIVALIALFVSIWQGRRRKMLAYRILSFTPLARLDRSTYFDGRLEILFDGKPLQDVQLTRIRVGNTGNEPILMTDFEQPVKFCLEGNGKVLDAEVVETNPSSLSAAVTFDATSITLKPTLLNSGDSITIKLLTTEFQHEFVLKGRIIGVKDIREVTLEAEWNRWLIKTPTRTIFIILAIITFLLFMFMLLTLLRRFSVLNTVS